MTRQALGYQAPVAYAISEGATAPNPGLPGVQVWSTTTNSLMVWGGATWNAIGGGGGGGAITLTQAMNVLPDNTPILSWRPSAWDTAGSGLGGIAAAGTSSHVAVSSAAGLLGALPLQRSSTGAVTYEISGVNSAANAVRIGTKANGAGFIYEAQFAKSSFINGHTMMAGLMADGAEYGNFVPTKHSVFVGWDTSDTSASRLALFSADGTTLTKTLGQVGTTIGTDPFYYVRITAMPDVGVFVTVIDLRTAVKIFDNFQVTATLPIANTPLSAICVACTCAVATISVTDVYFVNVVPYYDYGAYSTNVTAQSDGSAVVLFPGGTTGDLQYNNAGVFAAVPQVKIHGGDLVLVAGTTTAPAGDSVKLFGKKLGFTRVFPAAMGPSGMDYTLQPAMFRQKVGMWSPPGNSTNLPGIFGIGAWSAVGTATARNVATTNMLTRMRRLAYVSTATAGNIASARTGQAQFSTGNGAGLGGFYSSCRFARSDAAAVTGARFFCGFTSSVGAPTNVEPSTLTNCIGIAQLSTSSTQLYLVYGGSAAQTAIALGTGFPPFNGTPGVTTGVPYDFQVWCPPNSNGVINWQLDRLDTGTTTGGTITPATLGVQTPANTTLLNAVTWSCNNTTALATAFDLIHFYIETDY